MKLLKWRALGDTNIDQRMNAVIADIDRKHGPSLLNFQFSKDDIGVSDDEALIVCGGGSSTEIGVPADCVIKSITVLGNTTRSAGSLSVVPTINGAAVSNGAALDATNTRVHTKIYEPSAAVLVLKGSRIGAHLTSDGSWAPTTLDLMVLIVLEITGDY